MTITFLAFDVDARAKQARVAADAMAAKGLYVEAAAFLDIEAVRDDIPYTGDQRFPMMEHADHIRTVAALTKEEE